MIRGKTLFRGFAAYLLTLALMVAVFVFGIMHFFSSTVFSQVETELQHSAGMIAGMLQYGGGQRSPDYDALVKQIGSGGETRITLIAPDGEVLGDSHADIAVLDNHIGRPEVQEALAGGGGFSVRYSQSVGYRLMYYALPANAGGELLIVRASRSVAAIDETLKRASRTLQLISLVFLILALYSAVLAGQWIRRPLQRLVTVASTLAEGNLGVRAGPEHPAEFGILARSLNRMAENLALRMETVQRQRDEYQSVLAGMNEAVIVLDERLGVVETNRAAEQVFSRTRDEMLSRPLLETVRNLGIQNFAEEILREGLSMRREIVLYAGTQADHRLFFQLHGAALPRQTDSGRQARVVLVFTDITGIKQSEQIRKDFVSNVSHELKTPITSIKGFVETLEDGALEDPQLLKRFLGIIGSQADNMHAIIEDLLQLSRLDEQSVGGGESLVDPADVLNNAVDRIRNAVQEKGMRLSLAGEADLKVKGSPGLLEQAIFNLLDNAVKYSDAGGEIGAVLSRSGDMVRLAVSDNGSGIPEDDQPRIFERFYRVDKGRSRATGGTGLGLAIVKHIILVHGGSVTVESRLGEGSVFTLSIPAAEPDADG
jgi:two-component system, OmpR family, phosphate regulon sensor histidine kinase PhoR